MEKQGLVCQKASKAYLFFQKKEESNMKKTISHLLATAVVMTSLIPSTVFAAREDLAMRDASFLSFDREKQEVTFNFSIENYGTIKSPKVICTVNGIKQTYEVKDLKPDEKREVTKTISVPNAYRYDLTAEILYDGRQDWYGNDSSSRFAIMKVGVSVNGNQIDFPDAQPFIDEESNRTMVPVRFVGEALGAKVEWDAVQQTVRMDKEGKQIALRIGEKKATINGKVITFDAKAIIQDKRTFVPLRFVSEAFGSKVEWDAKNLMVKITTTSATDTGTTPSNGTNTGTEGTPENQPGTTNPGGGNTTPTTGGTQVGAKVGAKGQFTVVKPSDPDMLMPRHPETEPAVDAFVASLVYEDGKISGVVPHLPKGYLKGLRYTDRLDKKMSKDLTDLKEGEAFTIPVGKGIISFVIYQGNEGKNDVYVTVPGLEVEWGTKR
jgi:hypothetical protein